MTRIVRTIVAALLFSVWLGAGPQDSARGSEERDVSFRVRVCAGDGIKRLLNDEAQAEWDDCEKPLGEVPIILRGGDAKDGPSQTDKDGVATVGPIRVKRDQQVIVTVGCTTHVCLTLKLDPLGVRDGLNYFLYHTITHEELKEKTKDGAQE